MNPELPDDLHALIADALSPDAPDAAADARVKRRVLRAIAAESTPRHLTVQAGEGSWEAFGPGLQRKVLNFEGGIMSYLVRLQAGASLSAHRHPVDEECVVLEGEVQIGSLRLAVGGFHLGRRDLPHDRLRSEGGALIFLRGAAPEAEHLL